jgi:hypothetical protein
MMERTIPNGKDMKNVSLVAALATSVAFSADAMTAEIDTDGDDLINDEEMAIAVELGNLADTETDS